MAMPSARRMRVLASFDAFDLLYRGRGRSASRVAGVLVDMAERAVLT